MVSTRGIKFKFTEGERVLCYEPDLTKARVLYDSKVLELNVNRDDKGRKVPEYLIHFYGWSSSWDRCVNEEFILPDTEENRNLQFKLANDASLSLKSRRKSRISSSSKDASKIDDTDHSESSPPNPKIDENLESESSDEEIDTKVEVEIPAALKYLLEEDCFHITHKNKVLKVPCELNVVYILESFVKDLSEEHLSPTAQKKIKTEKDFSFKCPEDRIHFCKEVMDGIRIYFDFTLPHLLLYRQEKKQFYTVGNNCVPICKIKSEKPVPENGEVNSAPTSLQASNPKEIKSPPMSPTRSNLRSQKSSMSNEDEPANQQKNTERSQTRTRKTRSSGLRQGLRSSERIKLMEDSSSLHVDLSAGSGAESDLSPRPESPVFPTSPTRLTRQSALLASPSASQNKSPSSQKKTQASSNNSCNMQPTLCISNITPNTSSSSVNVKLEKETKSTSEVDDECSTSRMVPQNLYEQTPAPPSLIYGGRHLLRLFVKLPEFLCKTHFHKKKLALLLQTFDNFLQYLVQKKDEFFIPCYIDASEELSELSST